MGTFAFLLGLPMLKSYVAFSAVSAALWSSVFSSTTAHNNAIQMCVRQELWHPRASRDTTMEAVALSALHLARSAS